MYEANRTDRRLSDLYIKKPIEPRKLTTWQNLIFLSVIWIYFHNIIFLLFQKEEGTVQIGYTSNLLVGLEVTQNLELPLSMVFQLVILLTLNVFFLHKL